MDLAELYGVETRDINKVVENNQEKFPVGYIIKLTKDEIKQLVDNFHWLDNLKHSTVNPKAFTERGLYMLTTGSFHYAGSYSIRRFCHKIKAFI